VWIRALSAAAVLTLSVPVAASAAAPTPRRLFRIADRRIDEASGIAPGIASPGIDYVENDSGDLNRFFALDARTGATAATITVTGAHNIDWEDIAAAPDAAGRPSVWLADIGDNDATRREVEVYRVDEPHVRAADRGRTIRTAPADVWRLRYPSGPVNAESLAVAPDGVGFIVTKSVFGSSTVYRLPPRPDPDHVQTLQRIAPITFAATGTANPFGLAGELTATSAAISRDGSVLAVRTYSDAYLWRLWSGDVGAALTPPPVRIALPEQPQGEGIGLSGNTLVIDSEGVHTLVYALPLPRSLSGVPGSASPPVPSRSSRPPAAAAPSRADSSTRSPVSGRGAPATSRAWPLLGIGAAAVGLVGVGWWRRRARTWRH
jgi:hypothetical protein